MIFGDFIYKNSILKIVAFNKIEFFDALKKIEELRFQGYLVGYIRYDAYKILESYELQSDRPLLYFELFKNRDKLENQKSGNKVFYPKILKKQNFGVYAKKIQAIKNAIRRGDTYQLNYTYPIELETRCAPKDIFTDVLQNQQTPFAAYIENKYESILSFSPELFFEVRDREIVVKPMKGTIQRGKNILEDENNKKFLQNDIKNRSENVMIVDLLRNDLSKISSKVEVQNLFEVITLKTIHQMISTIKAQLKQNITFADILIALFPCGSVTGAPKFKTLQLIEQLEKYNRGVYCGMIGVISKDTMLFNVPIRTMIYKQGKLQLCVGSGIVWDSDAREEYHESLLKSQFIYPKIDFEIIETMRVKNKKIMNFSYHKKRLLQSVKYFGFVRPDININPQICDGVLRLRVQKDGKLHQEYKEFKLHTTNKIVFAHRKENQNDFLYHKTTYAPWYEEARKRILNGDIFDCIFYNEHGEVSEGARSNVVLQIKGEFYTPMLDSGILNGVMRQKMIKKGELKEKKLTLEDVRSAEKIFCINALRGMIEVRYDCFD
ncbi:bifunctional chorismate-binding protein/class IV aminotransferase [Helicobacter anatolicus]|uniref:bifunctional chorismate-binding protein/class IV aminotransferase n=1 Tax=Helicobacter anatolicus TaxID=2905874 RepID=UPI001E41D26E|nr:bifunctional anthranilate synthase component I family protein/class IV aminotransferase [Helicobacter anatolicus]MCE3038317.1 bifunctional anthranilate synthase component I family protein/class IV aminotransferase [Helicobacter anatolicus]